jgi:hypothetical protein
VRIRTVKRWTIVFAVLCVLGSLSAVLSHFAFPPELPDVVVTQKTRRPSGRHAPSPAVPMPTITDFQQVWDVPLQRPMRDPVKVEAIQPTAVETVLTPPPRPAVTLLNIFFSRSKPTESVAIFRLDSASGKRTSVRVGDKIENAVVELIESDQVVLSVAGVNIDPFLLSERPSSGSNK